MLRGFYAIVDVPPSCSHTGKEDVARVLRHQAETLLATRPCMLQLRAKLASPAQLLAWAQALLPLCQRHGVPFCVNDRLDVAIAAGADAVHLGQDDLPVQAALQVLRAQGSPMQVGISTHNLAQARAAAEAGAHYLGFGPVFVTSTKANPDPVVGLVQLAQVVKAVPAAVVAIGGITLQNVADVAATGAAAAAVISAVLQAPDPGQAAGKIQAAFARET